MFLHVLRLVADIGHTNTMEMASPLLQCWAVYRVFIVAFNVIIGIVFAVLPNNGYVLNLKNYFVFLSTSSI